MDGQYFLKNIAFVDSALCSYFRARQSALDSICFVYVCDINTPWEFYPVLSIQDTVVNLQWDSSTGTQLLISTASGKVHIYAMKVFNAKQLTPYQFLILIRSRMKCGTYIFLIALKPPPPLQDPKCVLESLSGT